jgi:elongation factor Tu
MTVEDVFHIRGRGTVLTGTVELGPLSLGDDVWINDQGPLRVDGIEAFRQTLKQADAGQNVGVLFSRLDHDQVKAGDVVSSGGI